jgi:hypothetical protein
VTNPLIDSLRTAVDVSPDDTRMRLHLAELLLGAGEVDDAIAHSKGGGPLRRPLTSNGPARSLCPNVGVR